ncbi:MAG: DUF5722 domain-containing protein [Lachnospiraceae bacterium]
MKNFSVWLLSVVMMLTLCSGAVSASGPASGRLKTQAAQGTYRVAGITEVGDPETGSGTEQTLSVSASDGEEESASASEEETASETQTAEESTAESTAAQAEIATVSVVEIDASQIVESGSQTETSGAGLTEAGTETSAVEISVSAEESPEEETSAEMVSEEETSGQTAFAEEITEAETAAEESAAEELNETVSEDESSVEEISAEETSEEMASAEETSGEMTSPEEFSEEETSEEISEEEISEEETSEEETSEEETSEEETSEEETSEEDTSEEETTEESEVSVGLMALAAAATGTISSVQYSEGSVVVSGTVPSAGTYYIYAIEPYETADSFSLDTAVECAEFEAPAGSFTQSFSYSEDLLVRKFVICSDQDGTAVSSSAMYITNPEDVASTSFYQELKSKKGLIVYTDAERTAEAASLGTSASTVTWLLNEMVNEDGTLNETRIQEYRAQLVLLQENGIVPYVILVVQSDAPSFMRYPGTDSSSAYYTAWNTASAEGVALYQKLLTRLAQAADGLNCRWIIGNEVNYYLWDDMGDATLEEHAAAYATTFRIAYNAIRSVNSSAQIYVPTDHVWYGNSGDYAEGSTKGYNARPFLTQFNENVVSEGDISWDLAFHAYSTPLDSSQVWTDGSMIYAYDGTPLSFASVTYSQDTHMVTMKNIEVVIDFMKQLRGESAFKIALTEQGWTSYSHVTGQDEYTDQAASIAYGYLKTESLDELEALILSRQVDADEMDNQFLKFGLEDSDFNPKYSYSVYRDLGTEDSLYTSALLPVVTSGSAGYISAEAADAAAAGSEWSECYNTEQQLVNTFSLSDSAGTSKCVKMKLSGLNASTTPYFTVTVTLSGASGPANLSMRLYSGEKIHEVSGPAVTSGTTQTVTFDFSGWIGLSSITGAELWLKGLSGGGTLQISGLQVSGSKPRSAASVTSVSVAGYGENTFNLAITLSETPDSVTVTTQEGNTVQAAVSGAAASAEVPVSADLLSCDVSISVVTGSVTTSYSTTVTLPSITDIQVTDIDSGGYTVTASFRSALSAASAQMPTWTEADGQDDLVWHQASVSGNTATYRVSTADHNSEYGKYITHVYIYLSDGSLIPISGTEVTVPAEDSGSGDESESSGETTEEEPSVDSITISNLTSSGYDVTATFTAPEGVDRVMMPTWTDSGWQDDLTWYQASVSGNTATYHVPVSEHNSESGLYYTHVYVYQTDGSYALDCREITVPAAAAEELSIDSITISNITSSGYDVTATFTAPDGVDHVLMPTWTDSGWQDDLIWYRASVSGNTATYHVPVSDHGNESGKYYTHVYVYQTDGTFVLDGREIEVPSSGSASGGDSETLDITSIEITNITSSGYDVTAAFTAPGGVDYVLMPTWTDANGQDELKWYQASVSGNTATYHVSVSEHNNESGKYITHVYVYQKDGRYALRGVEVTVPASSSGSTAGSGDYSAVFDAQYYLSHYPDLQAAFGSDAAAAYRHFLQYGMKEARQASADFNPVVYRNRYPDLNAAFGDQWELYYQHYIEYGISENRSAV